MAITQDHVEQLSRSILLPIMLVLDAWAFQYLASVYWSRRRESRVKMLLFASFLAFVTHIYSHDGYDAMLTFNDISETCLQLTFIIQITIIGRDVGVKVKVRSIVWFTYAAEALIALSWLDVVVSVLEIAGVDMGNGLHELENVLESVSLTFVLVFRFFYLSLSGGIGRVVDRRKVEFGLYVTVAAHEFPFVLMEHFTGLTWEFVQGIFMRLLIVSCILINVAHKARRSARSSMSVKSGKRAEDDAAKLGGSAKSLLLSVPVLARKPSGFRLDTMRTGSSPKIGVGCTSSNRRLSAGSNMGYVVDE